MAHYPWSFLGIPKNSDAREIKTAYARKLKETRPDDNPAAFQELVEARDFALNLAKTKPSSRQRKKISVVNADFARVPATSISFEKTNVKKNAAPINVSMEGLTPWGASTVAASTENGSINSQNAILGSIAKLLQPEANINDSEASSEAIAEIAGLSIQEKMDIEPHLIDHVVNWLGYQNESLRNGNSLRQDHHLYSQQKLAVIRLDGEFGWSENVKRLSTLVPFSEQMTDELLFLRTGKITTYENKMPIWKKMIGIFSIFVGLYVFMLGVVIPLIWKIYLLFLSMR